MERLLNILLFRGELINRDSNCWTILLVGAARQLKTCNIYCVNFSWGPGGGGGGGVGGVQPMPI